MGYTWYYSDVANEEVGSMICTKCKHPIHKGEYRYRETEEAYLAQHRHCSADDTRWNTKDKKSEADRKRLKAYKSFRDTWRESLLDDAIEEMEDDLLL